MRWLKSIFLAAKPKTLDAIIHDTVKSTVSEVIERELPRMIPGIVKDTLEKDPNATLTEIGFSWALAIALRNHWPDMEIKEASRQMWDYLDGVKFGDPGYTWNYSSAKELAHQYVCDVY